MDSSDEELSNHQPDTIRPYQFEPQVTEPENTPSEPESEESSGSEEGGNDENGERMDNLAWCDCEMCEIMPSKEECICCHEVEPVAAKLEDEALTCITEHEGFVGNCLNRHVIETSLYEFVAQDGPIDDNEPINELYRYIAYRRFTRWIWHILGRGRRKVIPSCAVIKIRNAFPSEEYSGFKYARP